MKTALVPSPDSIRTTLEQHARWTRLHLAFINRMIEKPSLSEADHKAIVRRVKSQRKRQAVIDGLAAANPDETWSKAYTAAKTQVAPDAA